MEALDDILRKRRSWAVMMDLRSPWEQKLGGLAIKNHPYYAIKDCVPMPFNWNGTEHIKSMMANFKMVSAKYYNRYGIYTVQAAQAFQLTDIKPLNY